MVISLSPNGSGRLNHQTANFNSRFLSPLPHLPNRPLFGTDGIRGKAGDLLTAPFALQLGFWAGQGACHAAHPD